MAKKTPAQPPAPAAPDAKSGAKPGFDRKNLLTRVGTALVFAALFLSLLWFGGDAPWGSPVYLGLMAVSIFAGVREMTLIARARGFKGLAEEQPAAYKDVDLVVDVVDKAGISKKVARLRPVGVIKG